MKECKKAGYSERLATIVAAFEEQRDEIESGKLLGESTKDITEIAWRDFGKVPTTPTRERPRVLFRRSALPNMRRHLRERTPTNAHFKELVAEELENNGALPAASFEIFGQKSGNINLVDLRDGSVYELPSEMTEDIGAGGVRLKNLPLTDCPLAILIG